MPTFFIDIVHGETSFEDKDGAEFSDARAACREARSSLCEMLVNEPQDCEPKALFATIKDRDGKPVFRASLKLDCQAILVDAQR